MRKAPPQAPRLSKAPEFEDRAVTAHFNKLAVDLTRELQARPSVTEARDNVMLMSPSGKVFKVTVDDAGALITEELAS